MADARDYDIDKLQLKVEQLTYSEVELLRENRELRKRNERLDKGYYRVKAERDELKKNSSTYEYDLMVKSYNEQLYIITNENEQLKAINDNLTEQLKHYKAIAGLNEPGF